MEGAELSAEPGRRPRTRRGDGGKSRDAILREAARLATVEGIDGLSMARLAEAVGMTKSGLFAHFSSKEELQLATVDAARDLFAEAVVEPSTGVPGGLGRLRALVESYLRYIEVDTFPGGCFFASVLAEVDMHPGVVRDRLVAFLGEWLGRLETAVREAQAEGAIDPAEDPGQIAFEVEAALFLANAQFIVMRSRDPLDRARRAIDRRLTTAGRPRTRSRR